MSSTSVPKSVMVIFAGAVEHGPVAGRLGCRADRGGVPPPANSTMRGGAGSVAAEQAVRRGQGQRAARQRQRGAGFAPAAFWPPPGARPDRYSAGAGDPQLSTF